MRNLLLVCSILPYPALAGTTGSPVEGALMQGQAQFEMLTSKTPLSELAPVPLAGDDEQVYGEIDTAICTAYQRWRAQGNRPREHMEGWCPTEP